MGHILAQVPTSMDQDKNGRTRRPFPIPSSSIASSPPLAVHKEAGMQHGNHQLPWGRLDCIAMYQLYMGRSVPRIAILLGNTTSHRDMTHPPARPVLSPSFEDLEGGTYLQSTSSPKSSEKPHSCVEASSPPNVNTHPPIVSRAKSTKDFSNGEFVNGRIHMRGKKGTGFDLSATFRMPRMSRFLQTNSASLLSSLATSPPKSLTLTSGALA